jgi:hypothetical protein
MERNEWCHYGSNDKVQCVLYTYAFCEGFCSRKSANSNYYPAIVVPKALAIKIKTTFAKAYKR